MKKNKFNWTMLQGVGASCYFMWAGSSFFSYWGFTRLAPNAPWWVKAIAGGFAVAINFIEFMGDNFSWQEFWHPKYMRDYILRAFWFVCYAYDIYTNMLGWLGVVGLNVDSMWAAWQVNQTMTTFAALFGIGFAIGPEPVYIWYLEQNFKYPGISPFTTLFNKAIGSRSNYYSKPVIPNPPSQYSGNTTGRKPGQSLADHLREKYPDHFKNQ